MSGRYDEHDLPTQDIAEALKRLLERNDRTATATPGEMYLGKDVLVVRLRRPVVIEGQWRDVEQTVDLMDLMEMHENGE